MQYITNDSEKKEFDVDDVINGGFDQQEQGKISPTILREKNFFKILFSTQTMQGISSTCGHEKVHHEDTENRFAAHHHCFLLFPFVYFLPNSFTHNVV